MTDTAIADISHIPVSQGLSKTLARASEGARASGSPGVSLEHVLAALCDDTDAADVLTACAVDLARLKSDVITYIVQQNAGAASPTAGPATVSPGLVRILEAAAAAARGGRRRDINGAIVLAAIVGDGRSVAAQILQAHGLTFDGAIRALQAAQMQPARAPAPEMPPPAEDILARARERVQSRAAPSLREMMAKPQLAERPAPAPGFPDIVPAHRGGGHPPRPAQSNAQPPDTAPVQTPAEPPSEAAARAQPVPEPSNEPMAPPERTAPETEGAPVVAPAPEPAAAAPAPSPDTPAPAPTPVAEELSQPAADSPPAPEPPDTTIAVPLPAAPAPAPQPPSSAPRWSPAELPVPPPSGPPQVQAVPTPERTESAPATAAPAGGHPAPASAPPAEAPMATQPPPPPISAPGHPPPPRSAPPDFGHSPGGFGAPPMQPFPGLPPAQPMPPQQQRPPPYPPPPPPMMAPAKANPGGGDLGQMPFGTETGRKGPRPPPIPPALPPARPQANPYGAPPSVSAPAPSAPPPSAPPPAPRSRSAASPAPRREAAAQAELGQLAENIPRVMRAGVTERVEIRLARAHVADLTSGMEGGGAAWSHDMMVAKAMSVRVRAPEGGFFIETVSPETQWIDNQFLDAGENYASWRFLITPQSRGWSELQIVVSARTVGSEGLAAETAFPDQTIDVKVRTNYGRAMLKGLGWIAAAVAGGAIAKFGEGAFEAGSSFAAKLLS